MKFSSSFKQRLNNQAERGLARRVLPLASFVLALALTTGCARPAAKRPTPQPTFANLGLHSLTDPGLKDFMERRLHQSLAQWPLRQWDYWHLTLAAWYFDPRLKEARDQWQRAKTELAAAHEGANATQARPSPAAEWLPPALSIRSPSLVIIQPPAAFSLPPGGAIQFQGKLGVKVTPRLAQAELAAESARCRMDEVAWEIRAEVRRSLVAYSTIVESEGLLGQVKKLYAKRLNSDKSPPEENPASKLARAQLRVQLALARLELVRTKLQETDARFRLARALALPPGGLLDVRIEYNLSRRTGGQWHAEDLRRRALQSRADMVQALARYRAAETGLRIAVLGRHRLAAMPTTYAWDQQRNRWVVSLKPPLPEKVLRGRAVERAEAKRVAAAARLLSLQTDIIDEVNRSVQEYRLAVQQLDATDDLIVAVLRQYAIAGRQVGAGAGDAPDPLLAGMRLVSLGVSKLGAQVQLQNALGSLDDSVQLPLEMIDPH